MSAALNLYDFNDTITKTKIRPKEWIYPLKLINTAEADGEDMIKMNLVQCIF